MTTTCCNCCKIPRTGYKLHPEKCGVCALLGKSKCYFDRQHNHNQTQQSTPYRLNVKTFESTEPQLCSKRPYESPQFSDSYRERPGNNQNMDYEDESVYINPFQMSKNQTIVMPVYYDVEVPIYPRKRTDVDDDDDLTTFRPSKDLRLPLKKQRKEPLHPLQLIRTLNIRR